MRFCIFESIPKIRDLSSKNFAVFARLLPFFLTQKAFFLTPLCHFCILLKFALRTFCHSIDFRLIFCYNNTMKYCRKGYFMRELFSCVAGNHSLRRRLGAELADGSFSHAFILEGPAGIGKKTLALEIVMALACENRSDNTLPLPCRSCPTCRKISAGKSPDVMWVERPEGKSFLSVDAIRELRQNVALVPNDLDFKVYIIPDAHTMNTQAQNAFLLTLEEPPPFVLFLLLTEDASALLETIRSRAPVFRMQPVNEREMTDFLLSPERDAKIRGSARALADNAPEDFAALLRMANGCIGTAISLLDETKRAPMLEDRATVSEICRLLATRTRADALFEVLISLGNDREEVCTQLRMLSLAIRDLTLISYSENAPLLFFTDRESAMNLSDCFAAARLFAIQSAIDDAVRALGENANLRLTLVQLLSRLTA